MLTEDNITELDSRGYTVVRGVLTGAECDKCIDQYKDWLKQFTDDGEWPFSQHSLIMRYSSAHLEPSWSVRMKTKDVFRQIWKTEKLLTSFDSIAIGRPPEESEEEFHSEGRQWLHFDQSANRVGLHSYQGGVYLEEADEDDWTLEVMVGSHKFHNTFFEQNSKAYIRSSFNQFYRLKDDDIEWFEAKNCERKRVPVPKGGMVLWDSRLIHANARPKPDRKNKGMWRYVVLNCMTPAVWARPKDINLKQEAYKHMWMTVHWPSQGVALMPDNIPSYAPKAKFPLKDLPSVAKTREAKLISGVESYDFDDGQSNGPEWKPEHRREPERKPDTRINPTEWFLIVMILTAAVAIGLYFV